MATRQVRDRRALDTLLNDDWNEQNRLDRSLVNRPRSFHDEALARLDRRQKPAKPEWEQGIPLPGREPPQQHQQQQESRRNTPEQLTAQTILNPATSKDVTVHFHMDVAGDIGVLLEEFSRLKRLGGFQAAAHYFDENLRDFADVLPVVIEYADMLVEQGAYQRLKDFLRQHNQVLQRSTKIVRLITDEERETLVYQASLQLIDVFASMHLTGNMDTTYDMVREVTKTARAILNSRSRVLEPLDSAEVGETSSLLMPSANAEY
jgi:hypothetical protein